LHPQSNPNAAKVGRKGDKVSKFNWMTKVSGAFLLWAAAAVALPAQTFTTVYNFEGTDGYGPAAGLAQGIDGNLYGTTSGGGTSGACTFGCGTVFTITPSGTLTSLQNFHRTDGSFPFSALAQDIYGTLYGTTTTGGANDTNDGTVYSIAPGGTLTTLHNFDGTDGRYPYATLVQGADGKFYGATVNNGAHHNSGTVFNITAGGILTTLYNFCAQTDCTDGSEPYATLVQGANGDFYGTTASGGANGNGTIFKITASGALTTLYSFCSQTNCPDGATPYTGLVQGTDGNFYGTTYSGGVTGICFDPNGCGTIFKITPSGMLTTLHSFDGTDGEYPAGCLVQGTDGNFYGTTAYGGANGDYGTIFRITASGTLTTLHSFDGTDGYELEAGLIQATNGTFYGTAYNGGTNGWGIVFSLSVGLGRFVETLPTVGKVGETVKILGTNLTGASGVTFNGTPAVFAVDSHSLITTTVPVGSATGEVQVTVPSGTLSSNVPFRVRP
jgi:uncharacterized repeat protein (TIGR03803 family)